VNLPGSGDQRTKHHRRCARIIQGGVGRRYVESQLLHKAGQAWSLALGEVEHEPGKCRGVDDRMLERAFEASSHQPGVESVVAVLDENRALGEP
jgi:hypothetical protein